MNTDIENVTVNGQPLEEYLQEEQSEDIRRLMAAHLRSSSAGVRHMAPVSKFGNISGERTYNRNLSVLSAEKFVHVNFLLESGGEKAVTEYLSMPKTETQQLGPIELALRDVEEKINHYKQQADKARQEEMKFVAVAESLHKALGLLLGQPMEKKVPRSYQREAVSKLPRGFWPEAIKRLLAGGRTIPRQQLLDELRACAPDASPDLAQAALTRAVSFGTVELLEGRLVRYKGDE